MFSCFWSRTIWRVWSNRDKHFFFKTIFNKSNELFSAHRPSVFVGVRICDIFSKKSSLKDRALRANFVVPRKLLLWVSDTCGDVLLSSASVNISKVSLYNQIINASDYLKQITIRLVRMTNSTMFLLKQEKLFSKKNIEKRWERLHLWAIKKKQQLEEELINPNV